MKTKRFLTVAAAICAIGIPVILMLKHFIERRYTNTVYPGVTVGNPLTGDRNAIMILAGIMIGVIIVAAVAVLLIKKNKK